MDKIIGWALLQDRLPLSNCALLASGRGGFEIIQKSLLAGIPLLASVSAASSLAVQMAREFGLTLVGFLRGRRFVVYAGEERLGLGFPRILQPVRRMVNDQCECRRPGAGGRAGERLIHLLNRVGIVLPQVCYHPQLGRSRRATPAWSKWTASWSEPARTMVTAGMEVLRNPPAPSPRSARRSTACSSNHMLYCTVCDNNNGNCTVHNTTKLLAVEHQQIPFQPKPYEVDETKPFYRYDPTNACCAAAALRRARTSRSMKRCRSTGRTLTPACSGMAARPSANPAASPAATASRSVPCNALMEKSMIGHAGFFTALPKKALKGMIDVVKGDRAGRPATARS